MSDGTETARRTPDPTRSGEAHGQVRCGRGTAPTGQDGDSPHLAEWLDEEEWNACFFLGHQSFFRDGVECRVCEQVCLGIRQLNAAGYRFRHLRRTPDGALQPDKRGTAPDHDRQACGQITEHTFDHPARARRALAWLERHAPQLDRSWLNGQVELFYRLHGQ